MLRRWCGECIESPNSPASICSPFWLADSRYGDAASLPFIATLIGWGGWATVALLVVVGLAMTVGFDRLFLAFHLISFTNDLWQLDPRRDYLIAMFPEAFFFTATVLIIVSVTFLSICLIIASWIMRKKLQPRTETEEPSDNRTPAQSALTQ